jgi:Rrf2 family iron-sulfur cluster assembly transcriptional regulator
MKFTRKTDYALRAMQNLARRHYDAAAEGVKASPVPVPVLAGDSGLSLRFLSGIMARLSRMGLVKAVPGPKGGLTLGRSPEAISILDIVEAAEGPINLMECMSHPENCKDASGCSIMGVLHTAQGALVSSLRNTNLKLMVRAKASPFKALPEGHYLQPQFGCPVLK